VQSWKQPQRRPIGKYRQQYVYSCPNTGCRHAIVEPFVRPAAVAIDWRDLGEKIGDRAKPLAPATMRRIRAGIEQFAAPTMIATNHDDGDQRSYPAGAAPMPTRSTKIGDGVVCPPFLLDRRGDHDGDACPHTLLSPPLVVPAGGTWNDATTTVDEPVRTRLTRDTEAVFTPEPWITVQRNHADAASIHHPLATVATGTDHGGGHQALTVPPGAFIQKHHGGLSYRAIEHMTKSVTDPMPSVVARPNLSLVIPYRRGKAKTTNEPLHTLATHDSAALVAASVIDIDECRFRMLKPREHGRAQRFPDSYLVYGNQSEQTMGFGNAVSSNVAQWLGVIIAHLLGDTVAPTA
jgi:DNA (cytosine-5)-methyltransferase 1